MNDKELNKKLDKIVEDATAKSLKILDRLNGTFEEENARLDAIDELQEWMTERGFDAGVMNCNLVDEDDWCIEVLDIGWQYGICSSKGYFKPIAVQFYHTTPELLELAKEQGFEVFTSIEEFKAFVETLT